jgi:cytochrome P450
MFRVANEDFFIKSFSIPKNTELIISPYFCGRNAKYFPDPTEFIPERFLKETGEGEAR